MYEGRTAAEPGIVFGHENMGIVDEVAPGVAVRAESSLLCSHSNLMLHTLSPASEEGRPCRYAIQCRLRPLPEL